MFWVLGSCRSLRKVPGFCGARSRCLACRVVESEAAYGCCRRGQHLPRISGSWRKPQCDRSLQCCRLANGLAAGLVAARGAGSHLADLRDGPRIKQNTPTLGNIDINGTSTSSVRRRGNHRTVMIMTLSAAAGVIGPAQFDPNAAYEFRIEQHRRRGSLTSSSRSPSRRRTQQGWQKVLAGPAGDVLARRDHWAGRDHYWLGQAGQERPPLPDGGMVAAGLFDDPFFFFDLNARSTSSSCWPIPARPLGARVAPFLPPNIPNNFFGGFNTLAIVMDVPNEFLQSSPGNSKISFFCRTLADVGDGRGFAQYDRMGIPAINTAVIQPGMPRGTPPTPPGAVVPAESMLDEDNYSFGDPSTDSTLRPIASARIQFAYGVSTPIHAETASPPLSCRTPSRSTCAATRASLTADN